MRKLNKRTQIFQKKVDTEKLYPLTKAIDLLKEVKTTKFDETVDVALRLGVDTRKAEQIVRGTCSMPNGLGKKIRVLVFAKADKAIAAEEAGADYVGGEDYAKKIQEGWLEFDRVVATPDMMAVVGQLGKVLGPKGLMPNPKLGTVTDNISDAVKNIKGGSVEYRIEKAGIVHAGIGKADFSESAIKNNVLAIIEAIQSAKPTGAKGTYIKGITLTSTMGVGIKLDPAVLEN